MNILIIMQLHLVINIWMNEKLDFFHFTIQFSSAILKNGYFYSKNS